MDMQMPKPGAEHAWLARLAGQWVGQEHMAPSPWNPQPSDATARVTSQMALDGFWLVTDYEQRQNDRVTFRGHGLLGYDSIKGHYTMHWFDSMGMDPGAPAIGKVTGSTLEFAHETPWGKHRYVYTLESADAYRFAVMMTQDDGKTWQPMIEGKYRRA